MAHEANNRAQRLALQDVTVIIVTFNSAHCLPTLGHALFDCPNILFADNGSQDETLQAITKHLPHARVLALGRNLGFGAANNRALTAAATPFALLLNPDCEISGSEICQLMDVARAYPDAAVVAPQLIQASGKPEVNYRWPLTHWSPKGPPAEGLCCVGFVCGAAMLFNVRVTAATGYFDERFFLYYEDDDLCLRLFKAKLPILLAPHIRVTHRSRGSVKGSTPLRHEYLRGFHHAQSKLIFAHKHQGATQAYAQRTRLLLGTALALPFRILFPSPRLIARMWGRLRGLIDWKS